MPLIKVLNLIKVIDVDRKSISDPTFNYLNKYFITYRDDKLQEHLINLQDAKEDIEIDKEWIQHNEYAKLIEQEVQALIKEANKSDAAYVRFISG